MIRVSDTSAHPLIQSHSLPLEPRNTPVIMTSMPPPAKRQCIEAEDHKVDLQPIPEPKFKIGDSVYIGGLDDEYCDELFEIERTVLRPATLKTEASWSYVFDAYEVLGPDTEMVIPEARVFEVPHPSGSELKLKMKTPGADEWREVTATVNYWDFTRGELQYDLDLDHVEYTLDRDTTLPIEGLGEVGARIVKTKMESGNLQLTYQITEVPECIIRGFGDMGEVKGHIVEVETTDDTLTISYAPSQVQNIPQWLLEEAPLSNET